MGRGGGRIGQPPPAPPYQGGELGVTNLSPSSQRFVTVPVPRWDSRVSVRFCKMWRVSLLLGSDWGRSRHKTRVISGLEKSDVLCFQGLLGFVPSIFVFPRDPPDFSSREMPDPAAFHWSIRLPERARCQNARNLGLMHALSAQFGFVLSSFSKCLVCFQKHTGFDRIILYSFPVPGLRACRDLPAIPGSACPTGPCLRQCVHKMTIIVGYHGCRSLSSKKRGNAKKAS